MQLNTIHDTSRVNKHTSSYREVKVGKILYRVTSVFTGEIDLKNALEDLAVRRVLRESEAGFEHKNLINNNAKGAAI
jgi:hypothetical protein